MSEGKGLAERRILAFFGGSSLLFGQERKQGLEGQGDSFGEAPPC